MASTSKAAAASSGDTMKVAVVGCGVAGLSSAYVASRSPNVHVTLFEARDKLGGHANTVMVDGKPVDTGFLVYNENTYPNLIGMFEELNVPTEPSDMSFAVSLRNRSFEWSSGGLGALFATRSNVASPSFYSMLNDMLRFNKEAPAFLESVAADPSLRLKTMQQYLAEGSYGTPFTQWYLVPQVAAVWSASAADVLAFPAHTFIQFCVNHSLVQTVDRPQWRTVARRSREYVRRIAAALPADRSTILLSTTVTKVSRRTDAGGRTVVTVTDAAGVSREFDHVIFGAHPDEVAAMVSADARPEEAAALAKFKYQENTSYLHTDDSLMPARKATWSSWNYMGKGREGLSDSDTEPCCVSYWLNKLQNLPADFKDLFVTLNPAAPPAKDKILQTFKYSHPQYSLTALEGQEALNKLQGARNTWYCGAYLGYGFHEDGCTSGVRVAAALTGQPPSWWGKSLYSLRGAGAPLGSVLAEVRAKKASGGPYWRDNLGNGGPVGDATDAVVRVMQEVKAAQAAAYVEAGSGLSHTQSSASTSASSLKQRKGGAAASATTTATAAAPVDVTPEQLRGSTATGDINGYLLQSPSDVLAAYRSLIGAGSERTATVTMPGAGAAASAAHTPTSSASLASDTDSDSADSEDTGASAGRSSVTASSTGGSSGGAGSGSKQAAAKSKAHKSKSGGSPTAVTLSKPGQAAAVGGVDVTPALVAHLSRALAKHLQSRRAFKDVRVGEALAAALSHAVAALQASGSSGTASAGAGGSKAALSHAVTVGELMARGKGGYTGQEHPLQRPDAYPTFASWAWETGKTALLHMAAAPVLSFLKTSIVDGCILLRTPDGHEAIYGNPSAEYPLRARLRVHSWNFFLRVAGEADLGLARSFIAGEWSTDDLTALFNIFIQNRDKRALSAGSLWTAWIGSTINYLSFAIQMDNSVAGSRKNIHAHYDLSNDLFTSFLDPGTMMYSCGFFDTSRRWVADVELVEAPAAAASSSSVPRASLDQGRQAVLSAVATTPASSPSDGCAARNAVIREAGYKVSALVTQPDSSAVPPSPSIKGQPRVELLYGGTLEEAQLRKLDHLIARANVRRTDRVLDLGFGWGGLSIRLAETVGCRVHGITLSKEQYDLAYERVRARGLQHLITFEIVDYRDFAAEHPGEFDRIISVEMIEAVGHNYFGSYMAALDRLLAPHGVAVIQAITMPEGRYKEYVHTTDFINTIIFPGGCCPCIASVTEAMMQHTSLVLNSVDQFNLHYGETLRRWRANFNAVLDDVVRPLGFDDDFIRTWNYYLCYCEAGFSSQTLGLQVLTFTRPNNTSLISAAPSGKLVDPLGPFLNDEEHPVLIPAGCV